MVTKKTKGKSEHTEKKRYTGAQPRDVRPRFLNPAEGAPIKIPEWDEIKEFFTRQDVACMLVLEPPIDLTDEEDVLENAAAIFDQVSKGLMPLGRDFRFRSPALAIVHTHPLNRNDFAA